jgi:hypothetical protein
MKEISVPVYVCDVCGVRSRNKKDIIECESSHTCPHNKSFSVNTNMSQGDGVCCIEKTCDLCGKIVEKIDLYDIYRNPFLINDIYSVISAKAPNIVTKVN